MFWRFSCAKVKIEMKTSLLFIPYLCEMKSIISDAKLKWTECIFEIAKIGDCVKGMKQLTIVPRY